MIFPFINAMIVSLSAPLRGRRELQADLSAAPASQVEETNISPEGVGFYSGLVCVPSCSARAI